MAMFKQVDPIPGAPSPYGLLGGCVEVVTTPDSHELMGTTFLPMSCATAYPWVDPCLNPTDPPTPAAPKTFDRPGICEFQPVTVQAGFRCSAIGLSYTEGRERALEQLRLGEQRALEEFFMGQLCTMGTGNDLTPVSGAVSAAQGVAILEGWLAENYGGQGLVHAPAAAAALFGCCNVVTRDRDDRCPETLMGNGVVFGAGYNVNIGGPGCTQAPPGEAYLYVTGPVRVRRDERHITPDSEGASVNIWNNDRLILAETTFVPEVACCEAAAVRIALCC